MAPKRGIVIPAGGTVLLNHAYSTIKARPGHRVCIAVDCKCLS